jgi:endonuclease/exonuclease/phosphatase family metal-dependent hydrolase
MELASEVLLKFNDKRPRDWWAVRAVVGFSAGIFVATLLAVFSVKATDELASWWGLAMVFVVISWVAVVTVCRVTVSMLPGLMRSSGGFPSWLRFLAITIASLIMIAGTSALFQLSLAGVTFAFVPFVMAVALFWTVGRDMGVKSCLFAGGVLLVICTRLFTIPEGKVTLTVPLAGAQDDDVRVMSWNVGGGFPFFPGSDDDDIERIAEIVIQNDVHVLCLQEVSSKQFLSKLQAVLGSDWKGGGSEGSGTATAVLSRIGGEIDTPLKDVAHGGPTVLRIRSHKGMLQFVSCHASSGRNSGQRREMVEWVLHELRDSKNKTVVTGDFNIDTSRGWTFLAPLLSDSLSFDRATWRALSILGRDPGFDLQATSSMGRRSDWVVVDSKMPVTDYRVLESVQVGRMDHFPVLVRVGLGKAGRSAAGD